ncbi:MAG: hypothetical protein K2Q10_11165 [Rhodospirillales bacterium]|nr:hypothetical protein [Rhodospirillales bacterium]
MNNSLATKTPKGEIPAEIRLLTVVARLFDLHGSRREAGEDVSQIRPPTVPDDAGFHLSLGLRMIQILVTRELDSSPGRVPLTSLLAPLSAEYPRLRLEDLEYCAAFLSVDREVRWLVPAGKDGAALDRSTRATTPLLRFHRRYGEVKLTDNARLLARIGSLQRDWLFEDKDVERIAAALERGLFEDVPRLCREAVASLRALNEHLTEIEESAAFDTLRAAFEAHKDQYREMLRCSERAVRRAIALIGEASTGNRFTLWKSLSDERAEVELSDLLLRIEAVLQAVESLSRHWVKFLSLIETRRRRPLGVVDFSALAERLVNEAPAESFLRRLVQSMGPWRTGLKVFSGAAFAAAIDLRRRVREPAQLEFDLAGGTAERFQGFLDRNAALIAARLKERRRLSLSELLTEGGFVLDPEGDIAELFGLFTITDELGEAMPVAVGLDDRRFSQRVGDRLVHGDDPALWLLDPPEEFHAP